MFLLKRKDSSKLTPYLLIHALSAVTGVILLKLLHVCMELEVCVCSVEQIGARSWDCEDTEVETERTLGAEKKKNVTSGERNSFLFFQLLLLFFRESRLILLTECSVTAGHQDR